MNATTGQGRFSIAGFLLVGLLVLVLLLMLTTMSVATSPHLQISENQRFIVRQDGSPFFYLGDTAWELFHRSTREEVDRYLKDRADKGFTVIQAVALAELDGLNDPNAYGHRPLINHDPTKPDVKIGSNNDYWDHVDYILSKANSLGLYIGFLPTWGDKWNKAWGTGPEVFNPQNAEVYGEWLGRRYQKAANIIWILGGDRSIENDTHRAIIEAMAHGLRRGDQGAHLVTLHPLGGTGSADWFHGSDWLNFNLRQNGHTVEFKRYESTRSDYDRTPIKPVLDSEPIYEDHPIAFNPEEFGYSIAADVRRPLYWNLFSGACGHTYGHHSIWQMWQPGRQPINNPLMPWYDALDQPGAGQMQYGRRLMESRPFLTRIPDDSAIVSANPATSVPGAGVKRLVATRDVAGSFVMVYAPIGKPFKVRMSLIIGHTVKAWWFNPRTGQATLIGEFPNRGDREFTPPDKGESLDWVLVLDDAAKGFAAPGTAEG